MIELLSSLLFPNMALTASDMQYRIQPEQLSQTQIDTSDKNLPWLQQSRSTTTSGSPISFQWWWLIPMLALPPAVLYMMLRSEYDRFGEPNISYHQISRPKRRSIDNLLNNKA